MKNLKEYLTPEFKMVYFMQDVITTSGGNGFVEDENELPIMPFYTTGLWNN